MLYAPFNLVHLLLADRAQHVHGIFRRWDHKKHQTPLVDKKDLVTCLGKNWPNVKEDQWANDALLGAMCKHYNVMGNNVVGYPRTK